jgi:hypothetical protein
MLWFLACLLSLLDAIRALIFCRKPWIWQLDSSLKLPLQEKVFLFLHHDLYLSFLLYDIIYTLFSSIQAIASEDIGRQILTYGERYYTSVGNPVIIKYPMVLNLPHSLATSLYHWIIAQVVKEIEVFEQGEYANGIIMKESKFKTRILLIL